MAANKNNSVSALRQTTLNIEIEAVFYICRGVAKEGYEYGTLVTLYRDKLEIGKMGLRFCDNFSIVSNNIIDITINSKYKNELKTVLLYAQAVSKVMEANIRTRLESGQEPDAATIKVIIDATIPILCTVNVQDAIALLPVELKKYVNSFINIIPINVIEEQGNASIS